MFAAHQTVDGTQSLFQKLGKVDRIALPTTELNHAISERSFLRRILGIATMLLVTGVASSKSSKLLMSWKNPSYVPRKELHRVLALGLSDKTTIRADFEDALAEQFRATGVETIAGNTILLRPESARLDPDYLRAQIRENNIDAVVVSRLIKVEKNVTYIAGGTGIWGIRVHQYLPPSSSTGVNFLGPCK